MMKQLESFGIYHGKTQLICAFLAARYQKWESLLNGVIAELGKTVFSREDHAAIVHGDLLCIVIGLRQSGLVYLVGI